MFRSLRTKLILSHLLVVVVGMTLAGVLLLGFVERYLLDATAGNLTAQAYMVARALVPGAVPAASAANVSQATNAAQQAQNVYVQQTARRAAQSSERATAIQQSNLAYLSDVSVRLSSDLPTRVRVLDEQGLVLIDSAEGADEGLNRAAEPGIAAALAGRQSVHVGDGVMRVAVPLFHQNRVAGAICVSQPLADVLAVLDDLRRLLLFAAAAGVLGAGLMGLLLAQTMSRPLRELTTAAAHLARGEFDRPLRVRSRDEIGQLGDSFRRMGAQWQHTLHDLAHESEQRRAILATMADGVLAADAAGRVLFLNPVAERLLGVAGAEGVPRLSRSPFAPAGLPNPAKSGGFGNPPRMICDLLRLLTPALTTGQAQRQEIQLAGRAVEVLVTPLADGGAPAGAVAVFHDVTGFRELEDLKTRFVSDVSHELRTPLTSIKGMAETLRAGAVDDARVRDRFLGVIEAEADRLTALVNDLLVLSRADSHVLELRPEPADVAALARESVERLAPQAAQKNVRVEVTADGPAVAHVDPYRIQQVLVNLLDNAIKYSPAGGVVTVSVTSEPASLRVSVHDDGPGIPLAAQPHIFERFYRADGSRSRATSPTASGSGTGLGLAIAKALVEAHGGRIELERAAGPGTTVSFTLPAGVEN